MSAADDVLSFEEQLRRLIEEAVASVDTIPEIGNRAAYVLGYVMGPVGFTREERAALDQRIYRYQFSSDTGAS